LALPGNGTANRSSGLHHSEALQPASTGSCTHLQPRLAHGRRAAWVWNSGSARI